MGVSGPACRVLLSARWEWTLPRSLLGSEWPSSSPLGRGGLRGVRHAADACRWHWVCKQHPSKHVVVRLFTVYSPWPQFKFRLGVTWP